MESQFIDSETVARIMASPTRHTIKPVPFGMTARFLALWVGIVFAVIALCAGPGECREVLATVSVSCGLLWAVLRFLVSAFDS